MMRYAVRYTDHGDDTERYIFAASPHEQAIRLRALLQDTGTVGEAVEQTFTPDPSIAAKVAREFVEDTVRELVEGERDLDEVNGMLRPLSPGLLDDDEIPSIELAGAYSVTTVPAGCVRTTRIEELAELMDRAAKTGGLMDVGDRDLDAEDKQREWLIRVLAGQEDHSATDAPCHRCAASIRAKHTTPAETKAEAA